MFHESLPVVRSDLRRMCGRDHLSQHLLTVSTPSYVSLLNPENKLDMRTRNVLNRTAIHWVALSISDRMQESCLGIIPIAQSTLLVNDSEDWIFIGSLGHRSVD